MPSAIPSHPRVIIAEMRGRNTHTVHEGATSDGAGVGALETAADTDADTDLQDVTFVVLDLETTGMSPATSTITEVGAVRYRSGERLATLHTLVDPGGPIPPLATRLTGISDATVRGAPPLASVLPSVLEFLRGAVMVCHNVTFDRSFLEHALARLGYPPLDVPAVDTLGLARRLIGDELPSHRLGALARYLRSRHQPCHRALDDALATADVFHALLERAATFDVTTLSALLAFPGAVPGAKMNQQPGQESPTPAVRP